MFLDIVSDGTIGRLYAQPSKGALTRWANLKEE